MKKAIILGILLALMITGGILEDRFVRKTFSDFNESLTKIEEAIDTEDTVGALEQSNKLQDWWKKKRKLLETISFNPDIRQVNVIIGEMVGSLEIGDLDNASSKVDSLFPLIENLEMILDFNFSDIL